MRPFPARLRPADLGGLANMRVHKLACVAIFIGSFLSLVLHLAPDVVYTIVTRRGAPPVKHFTLIVGRAHLASLFATFLSSGAMRRGPQLRAREAKLGSAFGIKTSPSTDSFDWRKLSLDMDDDPTMSRVIDYGNSSMLTFLTLGYVSFVERDVLTPRVLASQSKASKSSHSSKKTSRSSRSGLVRAAPSSWRISPRAAHRSLQPRPSA